MNKLFRYESLGETLSFAESLGWANWLDDIDGDTPAHPIIDEAEVDAIDYIESQGYIIFHEEVPARRLAIEELRNELLG
jgi:hypothetical protein